LFDIPDWPQGSHRWERKRLIAILDEFDIANSEFIGFWEQDQCVSSDNYKIKVSSYVYPDKRLIVVSNVSDSIQVVNLKINSEKCSLVRDVVVINEYGDEIQDEEGARLTVPAKDFKLVQVGK